MKKLLLSLSAVTMVSIAFAQSPRMSIAEEFTSANCGPCAATNPGVLAAINANPTKIFLLKYQHRIPSPDVMYSQNISETDARASMYGVNYNPFGTINGQPMEPGAQYPNHAAYIDQSHINALPATSAFEIYISSLKLNVDSTEMTAVVNVKCTQPFSGTSLKLRSALTQTVEFSSPPGSNGEKVFENIMRKMYPDAGGQAISNTWALNQSQQFTITGPVPAYVDAAHPSLAFAVFIQDDGNKKIEQAARRTFANATSINQLSSLTDVNLYPNPVADVLKVEISSNKDMPVTYSIVNSIGQQIGASLEANLKSGKNVQEMNTSHLSEGHYILSVHTEEGNTSVNFVK